MNEDEKFANKVLEMEYKRQYRDWIRATENGDPYYINEHGEVIIKKEKNES